MEGSGFGGLGLGEAGFWGGWGGRFWCFGGEGGWGGDGKGGGNRDGKEMVKIWRVQEYGNMVERARGAR